MKLEKTEKNPLKLFLVIAFALPYLLGILMGYGYHKGLDVSVFPNSQMYYPAAGVMLAVLIFHKEKENVPKRFYRFFIGLTAVMVLLAAVSIFMDPMTSLVIMNLFHIAGSAAAWIFLLTEKKEKRQGNGLCWKNGKWSFLLILLFVVIYVIRILVSCLIGGSLEEAGSILGDPVMWLNWTVLLSVNFFLCFAPFFGEEYGWRYYFTPFLQKHFGTVKGVLILGVLWGLWHLPINLYYYSPETWMQSILAQQITCITLGIFFTYTYMKTGNIWVPVVLHYLNNNLAALLNGGGVDALSNQIIGWGDLGWALLMNGVIFLPFLLTKEYRNRKNGEEIVEDIDGGEMKNGDAEIEKTGVLKDE